MRRRILLVITGAALLGACARPETERYPLKGVVVRVDEKARTATIKHERIGDWMEAMTMEFSIRNDADWAQLKPGASIEAVVVVTGDSYHLAEVKPAAANP